MTLVRNEEGFSLIELLVAITLFAIVSVAFYQVMFSGVEGGATTRSVVRISQEARAGFNRMVRDTREADLLESASGTSYNVKVDFNGDGQYTNDASTGNYENLTYSYQASDDTIRLNGSVLMAGVTPINGTTPIFDYTSNILEYDWGATVTGTCTTGGSADGVTHWRELDAASTKGVTGVGNCNNTLDTAELPFVSNVVYRMTVTDGDRASNFFAEAELRNRR